jgi:hypothetical protein
MRRHVKRVIAESLERHSNVIYMGEDVQNGGMHMETEGLASRFPSRVLDFDPDETTLIGAAMGFSQLGLCPIVEIPISCDIDKFLEAVVTSSSSNLIRRQLHPKQHGMVVRLQGFEPGMFGGDFQRTYKVLHHSIPGIDILCYSNGLDFVRGFRNAIVQAKAGRVVLLVDCPNLLDLRHLFGTDRAWERRYPSDVQQTMGWHNVTRYCSTANSPSSSDVRKIAIVSYGYGVIASLRGRDQWLHGNNRIEDRDVVTAYAVDVIDCPLLSEVPDGLKELLLCFMYNYIILADICNSDPSPLTSMVANLQGGQLLSSNCVCLQAPSARVSLGAEDIVGALNAIM